MISLMRSLCVLMLLATGASAVTDATKDFVKSSESTFDHQIALSSDLSFHWNDVDGNSFEGRLIHKADSIEKAPGWLGVGVFDAGGSSVTDSTDTLTGSNAIIGLVDDQSVLKYALSGSSVAPGDAMSAQSLIFGTIKQHDSDDGSVTTVMSFEKLLDEAGSDEIDVRHQGLNVFTWMVGPAGSSSLGSPDSNGAFTLDLEVVREKAEGIVNPSEESTTADANTSPVVLADCSSDVQGATYKVDLTPLVSFHYAIDEAAGTLIGALVYQGEGWIAHGFSTDGKMIGSTAIVGKPVEGTVQKYSLGDKSEGGVIPSADQNLVSSEVIQENGVTTLRFVKLLDEGNGEIAISKTGLNTFLYAFGIGNEFPKYHKERGSYRIDLTACGAEKVATKSKMGAFVAHGVFATLAWAILTPFAMTVAWFRTLVPSSWIYIHVFSNVLSFVFTLVAVIIAVSAMSVQTTGSHFSDPHHWVGLILLLGITFQVMNGFLRPQVEKKNPLAAYHHDLEKSFIKLPRTPREIWHFVHRFTAVLMLGMGIYQIQSGLTLFAKDFAVTSVVSWFWGHVFLFATCLVTLKFWIMYEEYKARRNMETMHVDHRSQSGGLSVGGYDSEVVPVNYGDSS